MTKKLHDNTYNNIFNTVVAPAPRPRVQQPVPDSGRPARTAASTQEFMKTLEQEYQQRNNFFMFNLWTMAPEVLEKFLHQLEMSPEQEWQRIRYTEQPQPAGRGPEYMFVPMDHPAALFLQLLVPEGTVVTADGAFYLDTRAEYNQMC